MSKYFGTDGFRGESNVDLTVEHAFLIGKFLGYYYREQLKRKPKVIIGKDTRRSSYMLEYAIVAGLTSSGADAYLLHVTTTPSVSYIARVDEFDLGIMISASHNPFYDNGIKLIDSYGKKLSQDILDRIENFIDNPTDYTHVYKADIGSVTDYSAGRNRYIGYLMSIPIHSFKGIRIGLDCANGASSAIAKNVFNALGASTYIINDNPDGFNINVECGSTYIENLQNYVIDHQLDIGFAYDGDADRCIAVDHTGRVINGDLILYAAALSLNQRNELPEHKIVMTIMSNLGVQKKLKEHDIEYVITDVGDKNVAAAMQQGGYALGGEQSGHVIFSKHSTTGDGILTSLKIMEAVIENKASLHDLVKDVIEFPQLQENIRVQDKNQFLNDTLVNETIEAMQLQFNDKGRILVRPSGTEPLIRIMVEAETIQICEDYMEQLKNLINKRYGG